jgi:DNA polymerase elongation subunit (family B)
VKLERVERLSNAFARTWAQETLGISEEFALEYLEYPASYFAAAKNYILLDPKGTIIRHGSGLKGSHRPQLEDTVVEDVARRLLSGQPVVVKPYYDWSRYTREDFLMRRSLGMPLTDYQVETVEKKVAEQLLYRGEPVEVGSIMEYYASKTGFRAYLAEDHPDAGLKDLDLKYYQKRLDRVFLNLGVKADAPPTLEKLLDRAIAREVEAVMRGEFKTCPRCKGLGWVFPRGKILPEDCGCTEGKVLVV